MIILFFFYLIFNGFSFIYRCLETAEMRCSQADSGFPKVKPPTHLFPPPPPLFLTLRRIHARRFHESALPDQASRVLYYSPRYRCSGRLPPMIPWPIPLLSFSASVHVRHYFFHPAARLLSSYPPI